MCGALCLGELKFSYLFYYLFISVPWKKQFDLFFDFFFFRGETVSLCDGVEPLAACSGLDFFLLLLLFLLLHLLLNNINFL